MHSDCDNDIMPLNNITVFIKTSRYFKPKFSSFMEWIAQIIEYCKLYCRTKISKLNFHEHKIFEYFVKFLQINF